MPVNHTRRGDILQILLPGLRRLMLLAALVVVTLVLTQHDAKAAVPIDVAQYANCGCVGPVDGTYSWAQTFTAGTTGSLVQLDLPIFTQPPSFGAQDDLVVEIQSAAGGVPSGTVLASKTVAAGDLPQYCCSVPYTSFTFAPGVPSVAGTQYAIVLHTTAYCADSYGYSNCYYGWMAAIPASHAGGLGWRSTSGGGWDYASPGMGFVTHVQVDVTPPVVSVPGPITVNATSAAGAAVSFSVSATDETDGAVAASCSAVSGATFAIGTTTVSCSATDAAGNTGSASFSVSVRSAAQQLSLLGASVTGVGPGRSFASQVATIQAAVAAGDTAGACSALRSFSSHVRAQSGKSISVATASGLLADAARIGAVIGC